MPNNPGSRLCWRGADELMDFVANSDFNHGTYTYTMNTITTIIRTNPGIVFSILFALKLAIVLIGIPVLVTLFPGGWNTGHWPDGYDQLAINLLESNNFRFYPDTSETLLRMPGFPIVLAAIFAMFGKNLIAVQIFNVICSTLTAYIVMHVTRTVTQSRDMAIVAAVITLFYPGIVIADGRGGLESFYMLFIMLTITLLYNALREQRLIGYLYFGAALGFTLLIKSTLILLPSAVFIYLLFNDKTWQGISFAFKALTLSSLITLLVLSPWIVRNYALTSKLIPTTSIIGLAAFQGLYLNKNLDSHRNCEEILKEAAKEQNKIANDQHLKFKSGFFQHFYETKDELEFYNLLADRSFSEYLTSPSLLAKGFFANSLGFWFQGKTRKSTILNIILVIPFLILSLVGSVMAIRKGFQVVPLLLAIAALYAPHSVLIGLSRYHIPIAPLLATLSSISIVTLTQRWIVIEHKPKRAEINHTNQQYINKKDKN